MNQNAVSRKAIFLSISLHVIAAFVVTLTVTAKIQKQPPQLSFLGSILQRHDLNLVESYTDLRGLSEIKFAELMPRLKLQTPFEHDMPSAQKPYFTDAIRVSPKKIIKPELDVVEKTENEIKKPTDPLPSHAPYKPLTPDE